MIILFQFLKDAAKPDGDFICWYRPSIFKSRDPDCFLLYGMNLGLLLIKVAAWRHHQIISFTPQTFNIRSSGKVRKKPNPDRRAKSLVQELTGELMRNKAFLPASPLQGGDCKIPVGRMVVFPNIRKQDYSKKGLQWINGIKGREKGHLRDALIGGLQSPIGVGQDKTGHDHLILGLNHKGIPGNLGLFAHGFEFAIFNEDDAIGDLLAGDGDDLAGLNGDLLSYRGRLRTLSQEGAANDNENKNRNTLGFHYFAPVAG